jgi:hypothetical protein
MMTISHAASSIETSADRTWPDARLDRVSEDSADSFPASDPPSWSPLRVGSPAHDSQSSSERPKSRFT